MREHLRTARLARNMTVASIAHVLGISASFYYKIEQGNRNPTLGLAAKLSALLGQRMDELFPACELDESYNQRDDQAATLESA